MRVQTQERPQPEPLRALLRRTARDHIQHVALDLFEAHGFASVTVEQVAAAAGVSPRTVYRHFGTKEALVIHEEADLLITADFVENLGQLSPVAAMRASLSSLDEASVEAMVHGDPGRRLALLLGEPQLTAALLDALSVSGVELGRAIASARRRPADDLAAQVQASAIVSALFVALRRWHELGAGADLVEHLGIALDALTDL